MFKKIANAIIKSAYVLINGNAPAFDNAPLDLKIDQNGNIFANSTKIDNAGMNIIINVQNGRVLNIEAAGNVSCGPVEGSVIASGDVTCGDVKGSVKASRDVHCKVIKGSAQVGRDMIGGSRR